MIGLVKVVSMMLLLPQCDEAPDIVKTFPWHSYCH